jgi:nitrogen fixation/metabolism regulation signal transduction histidine kinase
MEVGKTIVFQSSTQRCYMTASEMKTLDWLAYINGMFYVILGVNWIYNIYLLLRLRRAGVVQYNITTRLFYALAGVVIVARVLFLVWMDPPYGD